MGFSKPTGDKAIFTSGKRNSGAGDGTTCPDAFDWRQAGALNGARQPMAEPAGSASRLILLP